MNMPETFHKNCDDISKSSFSLLQFRYGQYGINWTNFIMSVLDVPTVNDVIICHVTLHAAQQRLLEITPRHLLWQFVILHSLLHSDLLLAFSQVPLVASSSLPVENDATVNNLDFDQSYYRKQDVYVKPIEERCLNVLEYLLPNVENSLHCKKPFIDSSLLETNNMLDQLRLSLFRIIKEFLELSADRSWTITNATITKVKNEITDLLNNINEKKIDLSHQLLENKHRENILTAVRNRNILYHSGKVTTYDTPIELKAFGVKVCFKGRHT